MVEKKACREWSRKKPRDKAARVETVQNLAADCRVPGLKPGVVGGPGFPWDSGTVVNGQTA